MSSRRRALADAYLKTPGKVRRGGLTDPSDATRRFGPTDPSDRSRMENFGRVDLSDPRVRYELLRRRRGGMRSGNRGKAMGLEPTAGASFDERFQGYKYPNPPKRVDTRPEYRRWKRRQKAKLGPALWTELPTWRDL